VIRGQVLLRRDESVGVWPAHLKLHNLQLLQLMHAAQHGGKGSSIPMPLLLQHQPLEPLQHPAFCQY
jgi:hypothetical protein